VAGWCRKAYEIREEESPGIFFSAFTTELQEKPRILARIRNNGFFKGGGGDEDYYCGN
jgi:hypothetical protein